MRRRRPLRRRGRPGRGAVGQPDRPRGAARRPSRPGGDRRRPRRDVDRRPQRRRAAGRAARARRCCSSTASRRSAASPSRSTAGRSTSPTPAPRSASACRPASPRSRVSERARGRDRARRRPRWYLDLNMIARYVTGEGARAYHHTAPITHDLRAPRRARRRARRGPRADAGSGTATCGRALQDGLERAGLRAVRGRRATGCPSSPPSGSPTAARRHGEAAAAAAAARPLRHRDRRRARRLRRQGVAHRAAWATRRGPATSTLLLGALGELLAAMSTPPHDAAQRSARSLLRPLVADRLRRSGAEVRTPQRRLADQCGSRPACRASPTSSTATTRSSPAAAPASGSASSAPGYGFGIFVGRQFGGEINLSSVQRGAFQSGYVGYWIDEAHAGNGYRPRRSSSCAATAFEELALHRLQIVDHAPQPGEPAGGREARPPRRGLAAALPARSTDGGRTTSATRSPPRSGQLGATT